MTQIDFIKAQLDLIKMNLAALMGIMLVIAWATVQNIGSWNNSIIINIAIILEFSFGIFYYIQLRQYHKFAYELMELPKEPEKSLTP